MIRGRNKILFLILMLVFSIQYSCERIEPEDLEGDSIENISVLNPVMKKLATKDFKYLGLIDQIHIFEVLTNSSLPLIGDMIFYFDGENQVCGKIDAIIDEGSVLRISLSDLSLNKIFNYLSLKCDFRLDPENQYIDSRAEVVSDTLIFEPIEILWDSGVGDWALLNLDSLKIYNEPRGYQSFYMGPAWDAGVLTKRLDFEYNTNYSIEAHLKVVNNGLLVGLDSIKVRERRIGPYYADSLPVYFIVSEWLVIDVESPDNNNQEMSFSSEGSSEYKAGYQINKTWDVSFDSKDFKDSIKEINWNKKSAGVASLKIKTVLTPVFCGQSDLEFSFINDWTLTLNLNWPDWDYSLRAQDMSFLRSDLSLFNDLPGNSVSKNGVKRILDEADGQLENHAPIPLFTINPTSGFTDTNFFFDAGSSYDLDDDPELLEVRWDFNGDEVWDTNFSTVKEVFNVFPIPGNYMVILELRDSQGLTAKLAKNVNVQAVSSAPTAYFVVTPESGRTSDIFSFDASGSWDSQDPISLLKVRWDFDGDDIWDTPFSTVKAAIWPYREAGTYVAKLEVKDTQGLTGSTSRIIVVEAANIKPTAVFTVNPEKGDINTNFSFDASESSDFEDDPGLLRVRWDFENDGIWDTDFRTIKTVNHIFGVADTYTVVLEIIDTDDFTNFTTKDIVVTNPNTPPTADFTISPASGDTSTLFTFDARISLDLEDPLEELEFRWDWDNKDPFDTEFSSNPIIQRTFDIPATYIIRLMVRDSGGLTHTKARVVTIE